jgi:hypothetical protein
VIGLEVVRMIEAVDRSLELEGARVNVELDAEVPSGNRLSPAL